jgi:hypothetical protein
MYDKKSLKIGLNFITEQMPENPTADPEINDNPTTGSTQTTGSTNNTTVDLTKWEDIEPAYKNAYKNGGIYCLVEYPELYYV